MALFGRQPERRPGRVLVASGARIDLSDKAVALRAMKYRQGWQGEAWCVDPETEALTRAGWKSYDQLRVGEEILTLDHEAGTSVWRPIEALNVFEVVDEPMLSIEGKLHSSLTTMNHRWPVLQHRRDSGQGCSVADCPNTSTARGWCWKHYNRWRRHGDTAITNVEWGNGGFRGLPKTPVYRPRIVNSRDLRDNDRLITAAPHADLPCEQKWSDSFVELVAWYWTEGYAKPNGYVTITQSIAVNPTYVARIRSALTALFGPPWSSLRDARRKNEPGWRQLPNRTMPDIAIFGLNPAAGAHLHAAAPRKIVNSEFILSLTRAQLELFVQTSVDADGHRDRTTGANVVVVQASRERLAGLELAAILTGRTPHLYWRADPSNKRGGIWHLHLRDKAFISPVAASSKGHARSLAMTTLTYSGIVWCPTTATGTWIARRNGTIYYTGNSYNDQIGELGFAHRFKGNACSRMRLFVAAQDPADPKAPPVPIADAKGVPAGLAKAAVAALERLGVGRQAHATLLNSASVNFSVPGECHLVGRIDPDMGEVWEIRSIDEMIPADDGWHLRELPTDFTDGQVMNNKALNPKNTYVARLWTPHPRFKRLADSPMRPLLESCEELLLLSRGIRAAAKSRMAANGLLYVADEFTIAQAEESDDNVLADPFMQILTQAMVAPILDEAAPSAVVPIVIRGPADLAQSLLHIPLDRVVDKAALETRAELIHRIATGLDLPAAILTGLEEANHWSAWAIDENNFKHHIEPQVLTIVDALTAGFLWPILAAEGFAPEEYRTVSIWYDPTELVTHPDRTADAILLWDRFAISDEALRGAAGFGDNDRPEGLELVQRLVSHARTFPPNVLEAIIHRLDPSLEIPADKSEPGYGPSGELEEPEDAAPSGGQGHPAIGPPPAPNGGGDPPVGPAGPTSASVRPIRALTAATASPAAPHRAGVQLADADRDLLVRLHTAADSEMRRALERAGARMRTKVRASSTHAAAVRDVSNMAVCATLGSTVVTAAGGDQDPSWSDLGAHWAEWVTAAQAFARGRVQRLVGDLCQVGQARIGRCAISDQDLAALAAGQARHAADGWRQLEGALTALFRRLLYSPAPAPAPLSGEPGPLVGGTGPLVPLRAVREALALAGGGAAEGVAQGVAVGADVLGLLGEFGVTPSGYEWRHGQSGGEPFEPHAALDGLVVTGPEDPRLMNTDSFPDTDRLWPGDHEGCGCQARALFGAGAVLGQAA